MLSALKFGGFALSSTAPKELTPSPATFGAPLVAWSKDGRGTVLQPLLGFEHAGWDERSDDSTARTHMFAPYHATPFLATETIRGQRTLVALTWTGASRSEAAPWTVASGDAGHWRLDHPLLGHLELQHEALPLLKSLRP